MDQHPLNPNRKGKSLEPLVRRAVRASSVSVQRLRSDGINSKTESMLSACRRTPRAS